MDIPKTAKLTKLGVLRVFQRDNTGETPMPPGQGKRFWAMRRPDNIGRMPMPQEEVDRAVPAR